MAINELYSATSYIYLLALVLLLALGIEALWKYKQRVWSLPVLMIYATTFIWYFIEYVYTPENFSQFPKEIIENSYFQVILFLVSFRLLTPFASRWFVPRKQLNWVPHSWNPEKLLLYIGIAWFLLLLYGITRMNGNVLESLFPIHSRAGSHMWSRAAGVGAGPTGFIVSAAAYTYLLVCSFLGILFPLQKRSGAKIINLLLLILVLPYYLLMGSRNQALAALMPGYFSYILFFKQKKWLKLATSVMGFAVINKIFTIIIAYRNIGFETILSLDPSSSSITPNVKHLGLNMLEELCYINTFFQENLMKPSYGRGYLAEFLNFVPRAIWSEKPLIGIDYAVLRGFGGSSNDIGVFATVSKGLIGQGIDNFGLWLGPIASAVLMAIWAAFIARLWVQSRYSTLRLCLFLVTLGMTFNLGRDITLLVLFPILFGYALVRFLEILDKRRGFYYNLL